MTLQTVDELKQKLAAKAKAHGCAMQDGDDETANRLHAQIMAILDSVVEIGEEGDSALIELLDHPDTSVRLWSATRVLRIDEGRAKDTLQGISCDKGILALNARTVLDLWGKGMLN